MCASLLRQGAVDNATLMRGLALDLPLDAEDVLAAEGHNRVTWEDTTKQTRPATHTRTHTRTANICFISLDRGYKNYGIKSPPSELR